MAYISNPAKTVTIEEYINCADMIRISYHNLCLRETVDDELEIAIFNVLDDYIDEFKERAKLVRLDDMNYRKYYQAPKILAYDLYKNTELDFIILRLNGIVDEKDFDMKEVYLLETSVMKDLTTQLYNAEKQFIQTYNDLYNEEG